MTFKRTDFVQVEHLVISADEIPEAFWRNALYVDKTQEGHIVIYANGQKQELHRVQKIRKAELSHEQGR